MKNSVAVLCSLALLLTLLPTSSLAQEAGAAPEGEGTITIKQAPSQQIGATGEWTIIQPGNDRISKNDLEFTLEETQAGKYTILVDAPDGHNAYVEVFVNGASQGNESVPQATFDLNNGDTIRIDINYVLTRTGKVSVNSDPKGLDFTLRGPNDLEKEGTTPASFESVPEGLYTVYYHEIEDCITPRPQSQRLEKDGRVNLSVTFACEALEDRIQDDEQGNSLTHVSVMINGTEVTFTDVPLNQWFSQPVYNAARTGIMTGYTDSDTGEPTGIFGPSRNVSIAELVKIAHVIAGINVDNVRGEPTNYRARGTWFEKYYTSAEQNHWLVFLDRRINPGRNATRAEVISTILQALDVPRNWPKGRMFHDVEPVALYAASIETAATDEVTSGYSDKNGVPTGVFGYNDPITRAALAKMITLALDKYRSDSPEIQPDLEVVH